MSSWTRTLLMAGVMTLAGHLCITLGWLTFEGFVMFNLSILVAAEIRRTP
jgi:hypothetical protein